MTRRQMLALAAWTAAKELRAAQGRNISYPLRDIEGTVTPADAFFERDHFSVPKLSLRSWTVRIEGRLSNPYVLTISDLLEAPEKSVEAVLECAGNGPHGAAVSNGIWEGVSLASILEAARPESGADRVLLEGAEGGALRAGAPFLPYTRVLPLERCYQAGCMVAAKLNGRMLQPRNGFPARVMLPGRYGMDWVKWLQRIRILRPGDRAPGWQDSGMDQLYRSAVETPAGEGQSAPVAEVLVKSVIAWPNSASDPVELIAGTHRVWGFAWTGDGAVKQVEFSSDGGRTWSPASLETPNHQFSWIKWSYTWTALPGQFILMSRATDTAERRQPLSRDPRRLDAYELNWCAPLRCAVV